VGLTQTSLKVLFLANKDLWERFENLVLMGARPGTLKTLLDLDCSDKEIQGNVKAVAERLRVNGRIHRGKPMQAISPQFLARLDERYHASVLLGISQRIGLVEAVADGTYIDNLIEIYQAYITTFRTNAADAVINFDLFVEIINGERSGVLMLQDCENCSSSFVVRARSFVQESKRCPFCVSHRHENMFTSVVGPQVARAEAMPPLPSRRYGA
jgi:hypothetical protein